MAAPAFGAAVGSVAQSWPTVYQQSAQPSFALSKGLQPAGKNFYYLGSNGMPDASKPIGNPGQPITDANGKLIWNPTGTGYTTTQSTPGVAPGTTPASKDNPFTTISNVKNPAISAAITSSLGDLTKLTNDNRQSLQDYQNQAKTTLANNAAATTAQTGALARLYDPNGVSADYNTLTNNFEQTSKAAGDLAMQRAAADAAARGMSMGSTGAGSYYAKQLALQNQNIAIPLAQQVAQQRIANLNTVLGMQQANIGKAQQLNTAQQQSMLLPMEANNQFVDATTKSLQGITGLDQANTFYGLNGPQTPMAQLPYNAPSVSVPSSPRYPSYRPSLPNYSPAPAVTAAVQAIQPSGGGRVNFSGPVDPNVAAAYKAITGIDPRLDPNFNAAIYQQALQQAGGAQPAPGNPYTLPNPDEAAAYPNWQDSLTE